MKTISLSFLTLLLSFNVFSQFDEAFYGSDENLFHERQYDISGKSNDQVHQANLDHLEDFLYGGVEIDRNDHGKATSLNPSDAWDILRVADENPVVSLANYDQYDPENQGIGFCFGRAMFVHLELAQRGFSREHVKKAFVVGPMETSDGSSWGWHVTSIAQSVDDYGNEIWLAIDPVMGEIVEVQEWYETWLNNASTDGMLKLYITDGGRFGPSGRYDQTGIQNDFYNDYFNDMMDWFEDNSGLERYNTPIENYEF